MDDQVVFLVEGEAADKAPELSFLLVLRLDVGQEERPLGELLPALWTRPSPAPRPVHLGHVLVVQPPLLEDLVTLCAGAALTRGDVKLLMFLQSCCRGETFVANTA